MRSSAVPRIALLVDVGVHLLGRLEEPVAGHLGQDIRGMPLLYHWRLLRLDGDAHALAGGKLGQHKFDLALRRYGRFDLDGCCHMLTPRQFSHPHSGYSTLTPAGM